MESRIYLFDDEDYQFALKMVFRTRLELFDAGDYLRKKYRNKPYMLNHYFDLRCEVIGLLIEEIEDELGWFYPKQAIPYCRYKFYSDQTLLVVKLNEKHFPFKAS